MRRLEPIPKIGLASPRAPAVPVGKDDENPGNLLKSPERIPAELPNPPKTFAGVDPPLRERGSPRALLKSPKSGEDCPVSERAFWAAPVPPRSVERNERSGLGVDGACVEPEIEGVDGAVPLRVPPDRIPCVN